MDRFWEFPFPLLYVNLMRPSKEVTRLRKKVIFTGNFWDYLPKAIGLLLLSIVTLGLASVYFTFWNVEYFVKHLEVEA